MKINLIEHNNYTDKKLDKLNSTLLIMEKVLNSDDFKMKVLNFTTNGEKTFYYRKTFLGKPLDHKYSNEEVYNLIMQGTEIPGDVNLNSMDLYLTLLNGSNGSVIGFGNPGTKEIFTYSTMFDSMDISELANHYIHEWCHKLGFDHAFHRNRKRNFSVPYGVGDIVEEIAETFDSQQEVRLEGSGSENSKILNDDAFAVQELSEGIVMADILNIESLPQRPWRAAESLKTLLKQVNVLAPNRNKGSDGTVGDASHQSRDSDHNPWVTDPITNIGVVTALDITNSPGNCDCNILADALHTHKDPRIKYVIWNRRIMNSASINGNEPWTWRSYGGQNPHDHHIHISVKSDKANYDSTNNWNIRVS